MTVHMKIRYYVAAVAVLVSFALPGAAHALSFTRFVAQPDFIPASGDLE